MEASTAQLPVISMERKIRYEESKGVHKLYHEDFFHLVHLFAVIPGRLAIRQIKFTMENWSYASHLPKDGVTSNLPSKAKQRCMIKFNGGECTVTTPPGCKDVRVALLLHYRRQNFSFPIFGGEGKLKERIWRFPDLRLGRSCLRKLLKELKEYHLYFVVLVDGNLVQGSAQHFEIGTDAGKKKRRSSAPTTTNLVVTMAYSSQQRVSLQVFSNFFENISYLC